MSKLLQNAAQALDGVMAEDGAFILRATAPGVTVDQVRATTGAAFTVDLDLSVSEGAHL